MLNPDKAKQIILDHTLLKTPVKVPLEKSVGLVIQEDIKATCPVPAFNNSAMDGYAILVDDLKNASKESPVSLRKISYISAGNVADEMMQSAYCYQIATGAPIPPGANAVVMKESVTVEGDKIWFTRTPKESENIRFKGEDIEEGEVVISKEEIIGPGQIGLLAAFGYPQVLVRPPIQAVVISTGSELVDVGQPLESGKIRDTNSYTLAALAQEEHCQCHRVGIIKDDPQVLFDTLEQNMTCDLMLISGGVSVGEHDYVKDILKKLGVEEIFWKVNIKPGKPFFFGKSEHGLVFGMPGNPASGYVVFEEFVRPAIRKALGYTVLEKPIVSATLESRITQRAGRRQFLRAFLRKENDQYLVKPMPFQGSHSLRSLSGANAFIIIPESSDEIAEGQQVSVRPLNPISGK